MLRSTQPLIRPDPGWLFILAGLAVCAAGILLPAQRDLDGLREQLGELRAQEAHAYAQLSAHAEFLDEIDQEDPALIKRLAAGQLNMVPKGDEPLVLSGQPTAPVTDWIEATVPMGRSAPKARPVSMLSNLAEGEYRLWLFAGGVMCVFMGLMLGPGLEAQKRGRPKNRDELSKPSMNNARMNVVRDRTNEPVPSTPGRPTAELHQFNDRDRPSITIVRGLRWNDADEVNAADKDEQAHGPRAR